LYISVNYDIEIHFVALFSSSSSIFCFSFPFSLIAIVFLTCEKQTFWVYALRAPWNIRILFTLRFLYATCTLLVSYNKKSRDKKKTTS
jgi:hypothetical protein